MQWNHTSHSTNFFSVAVALSPAVYVKSHLQHFINLANLGHFPADISILQNSCGVLPATLRISKATICHGDRNKQSYELTAKPVTSGILNSVHMGWSTPIFKLGPHSSFVHRCIVDKTLITLQTAFVAVLPKLMSPGDKWTNKCQLKKTNTYRCSTIFSHLWCSRLYPCEDCTPCWLHHWRPHQVLRRGPQEVLFYRKYHDNTDNISQYLMKLNSDSCFYTSGNPNYLKLPFTAKGFKYTADVTRSLNYLSVHDKGFSSSSSVIEYCAKVLISSFAP